MRIVTVYNHKGGIGKTVTAVNLAYNLTTNGYRVLVLDMDPQGNASTFFRKYDLSKFSSAEFLTVERLSDPRRCVRRTRYQALDIIPANLRLAEIDEKEILPVSLIFKHYDGKYDFCIIDCPPGIGVLTGLAIKLADHIIIPLKPDMFSADGLGTVKDMIGTYGKEGVFSAGLFTQFFRHRDTMKAIGEMVRSQDIVFYDSVIRRCSAVYHSVSIRRPLLKCASTSTAAQDYMDFTEEFLRREGMDYGIIAEHHS